MPEKVKAGKTGRNESLEYIRTHILGRWNITSRNEQPRRYRSSILKLLEERGFPKPGMLLVNIRVHGSRVAGAEAVSVAC